MKTRAAAAIGLLTITAAIAVARTWHAADDDLSSVQSVRVSRRTITTFVKATGVVRPMLGAQVRVGPRISGIVRRLHVRVGDRVRAGQLLAEIDDRELVARRREAAASLAVTRADLDFAVADLRRKRNLGVAGLLSQSDLDLAERGGAVAAERLAQAQATLDFASTQLAYSRIEAPIGGVVASVSTQEGETVAASFATPTFVTLLDLGRLEVWAYVDETDIGRVRVGQRATFSVDTYRDEELTGRVTEIHPQAEIRDNVVDYVVVVRFAPSADRPLRPEMTAAVRIALDEREHALSLPIKAVQREGGRAFVWRRGDAGFERTPVTLGLRNDSYWEVTGGVAEGSEIAVGDPSGTKR